MQRTEVLVEVRFHSTLSCRPARWLVQTSFCCGFCTTWSQAVLLGPPQSGKAHLVGRMLIAFDAVHPRVVSRLMSHGNVRSPARYPLLPVPNRERHVPGFPPAARSAPRAGAAQRARARARRYNGDHVPISPALRFPCFHITHMLGLSRRYRIHTKRYPLSLVSVPSLANCPHACIHTASLVLARPHSHAPRTAAHAPHTKPLGFWVGSGSRPTTRCWWCLQWARSSPCACPIAARLRCSSLPCSPGTGSTLAWCPSLGAPTDPIDCSGCGNMWPI